MNTEAYYLVKMREGLSLKQRNNPHYSLRAYARDIGIHPATLSQIINGKRGLPFKDADFVTKKLNLGPKEQALFKESLLQKKSSLDTIKVSAEDTRVILDDSYYRIIAEWEHYALLELFNLENFNRTKEEVSAKLDLTVNRTEVVIANLKTAGLIEIEEDGRLLKVHSDVKTTEDISSQALRDSHKEALQVGMTKLETVSIDLRDFSSSTLAVDLSKIPEAKMIIRDFRRKMATLLSQGEKTEVYQIAIQFYPLPNVKEYKQ